MGQMKGIECAKRSLSLEVINFKIEERVTEIISDDGVLRIGRNDLSPGECAAMMYSICDMPIEKPEQWVALSIAGYSKAPINASYESGEIVVTGADDVSEEVLAMIKAWAIGIEAACGWNSDMYFSVEIEGARMFRSGWSIGSDPYRDSDQDKSKLWVAGWEAANNMKGGGL